MNWFLNLFLTNKESYKLEKKICDNITDVGTQVELISLIKKGKIKFSGPKSSFVFSTAIPFDKEVWISPHGLIKLWHENPGFMSFSYLTFKGKEYSDSLKYGQEICLTIQDPKKNWLISNVRTKMWREQRAYNRTMNAFKKNIEESLNNK